MPVHLICLYEEHQQRRQKHQKHEGAGRSSGSKGYLAFSKLLTRCIRLVHQAALPRKSQNDVPTPLSLTSSYSRFPWRCHLAKSWIPASSSRNISPAYLMLYVQVGDTERSLHPPPGYFCMHPRSSMVRMEKNPHSVVFNTLGVPVVQSAKHPIEKY